MPVPAATTWPRSSAWQTGQAGPGGKPQVTARVAALDAQLADRRAVPEELRVAPDHRADHLWVRGSLARTSTTVGLAQG